MELENGKEDDIHLLRIRLSEKDKEVASLEDLVLKLVEEKDDVTTRYEATLADRDRALEYLQQETHRLQSQNEVLTKNYESVSEDLEEVHQRLQAEFRQRFEQLERTHERKIASLRDENEVLNVDLANLHTAKETNRQTISELEQQLADCQHNLIQFSSMTSQQTPSDLLQLQDLKDQLVAAQRESASTKAADQKLTADFDAQVRKNELLLQELESAQCEASSWFSHLQASRNEVLDLRAQLNTMQMDLDGNIPGKKGKTLFSEVEDRRLDLERKHISLQSRYNSLFRQYEQCKQEIRRLKSHVLMLLHSRANQERSETLTYLEKALTESRTEVRTLHSRIHQLERGRVEADYGVSTASACTSLPGQRPPTMRTMTGVETVSQETRLRVLKDELLSLQKEMDMERFRRLVESDKAKDLCKRLHESSIKTDQLAAENMKLRLKIDEMKARQPAGAKGESFSTSCAASVSVGVTDQTSPIENSPPLPSYAGSSGHFPSSLLPANPPTSSSTGLAFDHSSTLRSSASSVVADPVLSQKEERPAMWSTSEQQQVLVDRQTDLSYSKGRSVLVQPVQVRTDKSANECKMQ